MLKLRAQVTYKNFIGFVPSRQCQMAYAISANSIMYFPLRIINFIINCIHSISLDLQWSKFSKVENWKGSLIQTCHSVHYILYSVVMAYLKKAPVNCSHLQSSMLLNIGICQLDFFCFAIQTNIYDTGIYLL